MKLRYFAQFRQTIPKIVTAFIVLALFTCLPFSSGYAVQAPVVKNGNGISLLETDKITILSHTETIRWKASQPVVNSITIIKNKSETRKTILKLGMPKSPIEDMEINTPIVIFNGEKQSVNTVKFIDKTKSTTSTKTPSVYWYTWKFTIEPNETVAYSCSYTITPAISADGIQTIKIPMNLLSNWSSPVLVTQITLESSFPYMIDPSPSISPSDMNTKGDLIWTFSGNTPLNDLSINVKDPDDIAMRYLSTKNNKDLNDLVTLYKDDRISLFQKKSQDMLAAVPANENSNEIQYLLSQIDSKTGDSENALKKLESLETKALFGYHSAWFHQKMLFDRYKIMIDLGQDTASLLVSMKSSSPTMNAWVQDRIKLNTVVVAPQPVATQTSKQVATPPVAKKLVKFVSVMGLRIPVEFFFLLPIIIIVIIIFYFSTRNRKSNYNRKRSKYLYR